MSIVLTVVLVLAPDDSFHEFFPLTPQDNRAQTAAAVSDIKKKAKGKQRAEAEESSESESEDDSDDDDDDDDDDTEAGPAREYDDDVDQLAYEIEVENRLEEAGLDEDGRSGNFMGDGYLRHPRLDEIQAAIERNDAKRAGSLPFRFTGR